MDLFRKHKIEKVLNKVIALVFVITFFGFCSRDFKVNAPTIFALASILVYTSIKSILNYFSDKNHTKEVIKEMREEINKEEEEMRKEISRKFKKF
jgi:Kef-type K+ transport system membrane component KefB